MIVPNQRENIVTEYGFVLKNISHFDKFSHPKKWCWRPSKYTGNFSNCFIVLYKHLWTLKAEETNQSCLHVKLGVSILLFFYVLWILISWSMFSFLSFFDLKNLAKLVVLCAQICNWFGNKNHMPLEFVST